MLACVLVAGVPTAAQAAGVLAPLTLAPGASVRTVLRSPFGLSVEYPLMERALGSGPCPSPALVATFRQLGSPPLRVGGDSQDLAGPTSAYHYPVAPSFFTVLGCFARETGAQVTVGLNFGDGTLADAQTMVAEAEASIPASQLSFSLGNEPDLYRVVHVLWNEPSFTVPLLRGPSWSLSQYGAQWMGWRSLLGPIRLEGPDLATSRWAGGLGRLLRRDPPAQVTAHFYPTVASGPQASATARRLLSRYAALEQINQLGWVLADARAVHRPAVISESNSASRGGKPGLSDSPVASIWATRFVLRALLDGYQEVFFHSAGVSYDPFVFNADGTVTPRPLASALSFLHRWLPVGSRLQLLSGESDVYAVRVSGEGGSSVILTSFAGRAVDAAVRLPGSSADVLTDTLSSASGGDVQSSLPRQGQLVRLRLAPSSVVAVSAG